MKLLFTRGTTDQNNALVLPEGMISIDTEKNAVRIHDGVTPGGFEVVGVKAYEPPTGPGPKTLMAGNEEYGLYGTVSASELITSTALASQVGISVGTDHGGNWVKFHHKGKVLFVADRVMRNYISWNQLNAAGVIFGTTTITIGEYSYRVRVLTGGDADPSGRDGGEWNELVGRLFPSDPDTSDWGNPGIDFGIPSDWTASLSIAQEKLGAGPTYVVVRGGPDDPLRYGSSVIDRTDIYSGWRPVLELVP